MSEKVVLTQEQADAVKELHEHSKEKDVVLHATGRWTNKKYLPLNDIDLDTFIKALYIGYEVEKPKFKMGDKVVTAWEKDNSFYILGAPYPEISDFEKGKGWHLVNQPYGIQEENIRHATPDEIFWLHELGRGKIFEYKEGDIFVNTNGVHIEIKEKMRPAELNLILSMKNCKGIYPAESFKPFKKEQPK